MFLYQIIIRLFFAAAWLSSFFSAKSKKWIDGRKNWREKLKRNNFENAEWVWFHCASFGEFQEGKTLLKKFRQQFPAYKILLSFFSPSGYEVQKNTNLADAVFYLPLDTKSNAKYFLDLVKPRAAFFIRTDIWANFITENYNRNIPQFLVSFIFSSKSFTGFPQKFFYRKIFRKLNHVFVQNEESKNIYEQSGFGDNVSVCGNLRIENVVDNVKTDYKNSFIEKFSENKFCVVAGSAREKDTEIFLETVQKNNSKNIAWIIVPHDVNRDEIARAKKIFGDEMVCLSDSQNITHNKKILWIDEVGILAKIYRYADVVYIGGGFEKTGVHNYMEAVAYGCPVCFAPNYRNYAEAIYLLKSEGASVINNANELQSFISKYEGNASLLKEVNEANRNYALSNVGASEKILKYLLTKHFSL